MDSARIILYETEKKNFDVVVRESKSSPCNFKVKAKIL